MTKSTRSRLTGLDLRLLSMLFAGFAAPFALGITAAGESTPPDDETDEEKKKREEKEKEEKAKAEEDEKKKKDEEAKAKAAARPGISACLAGAFASLKGSGAATLAADLKAEQSAHAATKGTLTQAQSDLTAVRASLASTESALATLCAYVGVKPAEIAGKSSAEITAALDAKIRAEAVEQVAGLGFNPKGLPAPSGSGTGEQKTKDDLFREYNAIADANARAAFYAQHKAAMGL